MLMVDITPSGRKHNRVTNRLAHSASPYLRQHKDNPVDWYEWSEQAFAEAQTKNKPILLSVGYSACHWCHVMAHESFENADVAAVMNRLFVNIKVDREERPDVDAIYMDAVQALTGRGGWPMTVFLTPTGEPFYGGTYYPAPTFVKLMEAIDDVWKTRRDEVNQNVSALMEALSRTARVEPAGEINPREIVNTTVTTLLTNFDSTWGGFGGAPKFPSTFGLDVLTHVYHDMTAISGDDTTANGSTADIDRIKNVVMTSLDAMAAGGMYDHIGGGFSRYSVDEQWLVPHFEKMLYDQALLLRAYVHAWAQWRVDRHLQVIEETVQYVLTDLSHPLGGFFSAEDADSLTPDGHSHEGAFYTWTPEEVREVLGDAATEALDWYGITEGGNFEGRSIPNRLQHRANITRPDHIEKARQLLHETRATRSRPGCDDKVLTEWNAMMLSSLIEASLWCKRPDWLSAAVKNAEFLVSHLKKTDGSWHRSWQDGAQPPARHNALAHDYAHLVDAMCRLNEATGHTRWLNEARESATYLIEHFWDHDNGGFFTVADNGETLIVRQKDLMDNATASANSVAAAALTRLATITGDNTYLTYADHTLRLLARVAPSAPSAFCNFLLAVRQRHLGYTEVVIPNSDAAMLDVVYEKWRPSLVVAHGERTDSPLWQGREDGFAYVCRNYACLYPASTADELRDRLSENL
jgi:uncharacterized protein YyaL (SSP411 family)